MLPTRIRQLRGVLSPRRLVLLATVASLGTAALFAGLDGSPKAGLPAFSVAGAAEKAQRPAGFADIVEKVKPSVISVRVKIDGAAQMMGRSDVNGPGLAPGSPAERFFRRFGLPDGVNPQEPRRHKFSMGPGSGFFISADGYAIT